MSGTVNTGRVKWFNHTRGYGFVTNLDGGDNPDIFVHHSSLTTKDGVYRTLYQGEYVEYTESTDSKNKVCASNVTGIRGGELMCERESMNSKKPRKSDDHSVPDGGSPSD
jgi:cold shock CspA family protein